MRLKYLTLNKIIDVCYFCGIDGTPVSVLIAAPPGTGKTTSTKSLRSVDFVQYINHVMSPNEHRAVIAEHAARTRLLINDDLGLAARWNQAEYFSTFCMVADGEISYTQYKQSQRAIMTCSMVIIGTLDYYNANRQTMVSMGLYSRLVPIVLGLSQITRREYQRSLWSTTRIPTEREPDIIERDNVKTDMITSKDIDPRLQRNLGYMSQYLTDDEFSELVAISHEKDRFEV